MPFVRFADQKAAFAFAFSLGTLAFLFSQQIYSDLFIDPVAWLRGHRLAGLGSTLLVLSCGLLMAAVLPRLWWSSQQKLSLTFWEDVVQIGSAAKYLEAVRKASAATLHKEIADHCFTLSGICTRKYTLVKYGMWAGVTGAVLGVLALT